MCINFEDAILPFGNGNAELIETVFHINDIILYTNCRNEKEVIVVPECLDCLDWYFG